MVDTSNQRLGVFGGTFSPPHLGHLRVAQEAWYRSELERVIFMPAAQNPLKDETPETTGLIENNGSQKSDDPRGKTVV